jgi:2'-deoxycytidine 5'-triphosphate deaminase (DCD)
MPGVFVVPAYVELPDGFDRAIDTPESHLRRAGYAFYTGKPLRKTLVETTKQDCSTNSQT